MEMEMEICGVINTSILCSNYTTRDARGISRFGSKAIFYVPLIELIKVPAEEVADCIFVVNYSSYTVTIGLKYCRLSHDHRQPHAG